MKKTIYLILLLLSDFTFAQTLSHKSLSSMGAQYSGSNFSLSSSTGISFGSTLSAGGYQLTQGFQQPVWKFFKDQDGDTYGNRDSIRYDFVQPQGYVLDSSDCNDFDASIHNVMHVAQIVGPANLVIGSTYSFSDSSMHGIWSLSSTNLATVDSVGNLTTLAAGTDTLYYAIQNACGITKVYKILTITNPCLPSYVPTNGLVGWWPFCGNANDESGNGYNGIVNGATLTKDRNGNINSAYWFDSTFIEVSNSSNLNFSNISVNLWYLNKNVRLGEFISKHQSGSYNSSFVLYNEGILGCGPQWYTTSSNNNVASIWKSGFCDTTSWHMLSGIYSNGIMSLYIDGIYYSSLNQSSIKATSLPIIIGGTNSTPTIVASDSKMKLDDIGIWNRALTPAEIQALYLSGQPCTVTHTTTRNICHRDSTLWNGKYYSSIGTDTVHLTSIHGCDSVDILNLNVYPLYYNVITQYFCQGDSIIFNGQHIKNAGTYFYHFTSITGCDSTVRLRALFYPKTVTKLNLNICLNSTVTYGGQTYSNAGVFAQYYTNQYGCDSVVQLTITKRLPSTTNITRYKCFKDSIAYNGAYFKSAGLYSIHLTNKYGCDSLIKLTVINRPNSAVTITRYFCVGDSVIYNGNVYKLPGTYLFNYSNKYGCDSVLTLRILNYPIAPAQVVKRYICPGSSVQYAGNTYSSSGKYLVHLTNRFGCDSLVQLAVYFNPLNSTNVTVYRCSNDSVLYVNRYYAQNGLYTVRLTNKYGCDSIINLQVLSRPTSTKIITYVKCKSDSIQYLGKYYNQAGTYLIRLTNSVGCDSVVTLRVLNYPNTVTYITRALCQGSTLTYNGVQYTQAGVYAQHFINQYGCDSIVQITISKLLVSYSNKTIYKCPNDSVSYNGVYYSANGLYTVRLTNYLNCDSIIRLMVLTYPVSYTINTQYICQGDSLLYQGVYYKQTGTYFIHLTNYFGCDSTVRLRLLYNNSSSLTTVTLCQAQTYMWNGTTYTWNMPGTYVRPFINYKGCDSVATLKIYKGNCKLSGEAIGTTVTTTEDATAETSPTSALEAAHNFEMSIYPNPNTGRFILENNCTTCKQMQVEIRSLDGKLLYSQNADNSTGKINIDLNLTPGMYWVKMSNVEEGFSEVRKFVINNE